MSFFFRFPGRSSPTPAPEGLQLPNGPVRLLFVPNRSARRYILRLLPKAAVRVTIPRGGSRAEAVRFAERCRFWIERQLLRQNTQPSIPPAWTLGTTILFRGEPVRFDPVPGHAHVIQFGPEIVSVNDPSGDFRQEVELYLRGIAKRELPPRVLELAAAGVGFPVRRVSVRNQRSRWGSCSRRGTISLNWRLVQAPPFVRDYIIYHELAHLREMNHSRRYWSWVRLSCPDYPAAEQWLKRHSSLLQ